MKWTLILGVLMCFSGLQAQPEWDNLILEQQQLHQRSMLVLGGWGVANVAVGAIGITTTDGAERHFHQMNLGWGVINTGLAISGYLGAKKYNLQDPIEMSLLQKNLGISKAFLFNAGLDVGYVMGGLYLRERAKTDISNSERLKGFGNSVMLQGAFLFGFDLVAYFLNHQKEKKIQDLMIEIGSAGSGIGLTLKF